MSTICYFFGNARLNYKKWSVFWVRHSKWRTWGTWITALGSESDEITMEAIIWISDFLFNPFWNGIAYSVTNVSRFNSCYGMAHLTAVKRILRYLKGTIDWKLWFNSECKIGIHGFSDSDWASEIDRRRSCSGFVFKFQGGAISWSSRFQPTVATSTCEAEYMALGAAVQGALWLKQFNQQLGWPVLDDPILINCDNMSAIYISKNDAYLPRTKHIDIRHHFVRDCINSSKIIVGVSII